MSQPLREIAFDTETTGLDWAGEDRIIELGAVELINHVPTGRTFHERINPRRAVSATWRTRTLLHPVGPGVRLPGRG